MTVMWVSLWGLTVSLQNQMCKCLFSRFFHIWGFDSIKLYQEKMEPGSENCTNHCSCEKSSVQYMEGICLLLMTADYSSYKSPVCAMCVLGIHFCPNLNSRVYAWNSFSSQFEHSRVCVKSIFVPIWTLQSVREIHFCWGGMLKLKATQREKEQWQDD